MLDRTPKRRYIAARTVGGPVKVQQACAEQKKVNRVHELKAGMRQSHQDRLKFPPVYLFRTFLHTTCRAEFPASNRNERLGYDLCTVYAHSLLLVTGSVYVINMPWRVKRYHIASRQI